MARMPRGEPRSVPDGVEDHYDAAMRRRRLKNEGAEVTSAWPSVSSYLTSFPFSEGRFDFLKETSRADPTVTIGRQTYREVDNGRASVLIPVDDPLTSPSVLAERRRAVQRALFMADHPLGSVAYDVATLANASSGTRDGALLIGGLADAATMGAAFGGPQVSARTAPPKRQPDPPAMTRKSIRLRDLNGQGQAQGVNATITEPMLGSGTKAYWRRRPPGWKGNGNTYKESRGHLLARELGGSGKDMRNLVTITQNKANLPYMSSFEGEVARRIREGEVMEYSATPLYCEGVLPPSSILLQAYGSRGAPIARIAQNPAGRRK